MTSQICFEISMGGGGILGVSYVTCWMELVKKDSLETMRHKGVNVRLYLHKV